MKIPGGVSYTTFQLTQKGREAARLQREGKSDNNKKQEEDHCHEHHDEEKTPSVRKQLQKNKAAGKMIDALQGQIEDRKFKAKMEAKKNEVDEGLL